MRVVAVWVEPVDPATALGTTGEPHNGTVGHQNAIVPECEVELRIENAGFLPRELARRDRADFIVQPQIVVDVRPADELGPGVDHALRQVALGADVLDVFAGIGDRTGIHATVFPGGNVGIHAGVDHRVDSTVDIRQAGVAGQRTGVRVGRGIGSGTTGHESRHEGGGEEESQLLHNEPPLERSADASGTIPSEPTLILSQVVRPNHIFNKMSRVFDRYLKATSAENALSFDLKFF